MAGPIRPRARKDLPMYVLSHDGMAQLPSPSPWFLHAYKVPRLHTLSPHPMVGLCVWEEEGCRATRSTLDFFSPLPLRFHFPPWAPPRIPAQAFSLWRWNIFKGPLLRWSLLKLHMQVQGTIHSAGVYAHYSGDVFLPWGRGLMSMCCAYPTV